MRAARDPRCGVVVIVGASSGIGRATALRFARHRGSLVLAARSRDSLEEVAAECRRRGADVLVQPTDVSDEVEVQALADAAVDRFGRIDVWIGAASVFSYGSFEDTPAEVFRQQLETNLMGQVYSARAALAVFRRHGGGEPAGTGRRPGGGGRKPSPRRPIGRIVFVASIYSRVTSPYASGYITAKHGLLGFSDTLREEVRREGIEVSAVLPATIDTPIYQQAANFTGQRVHPLPPIAAPSRVAAAIERVTVRPRRAVTVGRSQGLLVPLRNAAPGIFARAVRPAMDVMALRGGDVEPSPGNVFAPQPDLNAVTGGWRRPRVPRLLPLAATILAVLVFARSRSASR